MQQLIIFLGNQGSEKDQLFQLLPFEQQEIVFEKLIIKERIDQGEQKLIFINFPEENEITQAINSLLALSKYFIIRQIIICLHFVQSLPQRIQYIQKKFNEALNQEVENVYTFFISDSPQISYDNRLYQFSKIDESNKQSFIRILEEVSTPQYKRNSQICQTYLQQSVLNQQEQLQKRVNNLNKKFQQEYLSTYLETNLESKVQTLLSNEIQPFNIEILDKNIKQNQIALYSEAIYILCNNEQDYSQQFNKFRGTWFKNFQFCTKCKILYQKQDNKSIIYQLQLFSLDQNSIDIEIPKKFINCKEQCYLSQRQTYFIPFLFKIYIFKYIKNNLKMNERFLVETTKKQLTQERIFNKKNKRDCIAILLLSNEDGLKQSVMQQVYDRKNYKESNQFKELQILNDYFYLIDSPIFQFDEDSEQLESIYSNYLNSNPIHYIIFCVKLQRSSLIKERLLSMSKKFPKINKQLFGAFIIDQMNDVSIFSEHETINCIKDLMPSTTLIQNSNTSEDVIEKISDFIKNVDQTQPLSFEQTIFCKQGNESNREQIENSLMLMSQNISDQFIQNCHQEIKDEELKQENLQLQKQQFKQQISNVKNEFQEKKIQLKNLICQIEQEIKEQEQICRENVKNLEDQIVQTDKDYNTSMYNIREKKRQLNQMEFEKIKKSCIINYGNTRKYQ
ncbi:unnamed protein product [Paramecium pentaurelia]|uniref:Uncharacterized protein n=1 Tax=Paramecium pentaurelia TaxID=43138 RepID=A0A8S1XUZ8_9CILI|nr:unnamed protein product [Paramecium pentaurelia]